MHRAALQGKAIALSITAPQSPVVRLLLPQLRRSGRIVVAPRLFSTTASRLEPGRPTHPANEHYSAIPSSPRGLQDPALGRADASSSGSGSVTLDPDGSISTGPSPLGNGDGDNGDDNTSDAATAAAADAKRARREGSVMGMYAELCKARLSSLVVMTTGAGFLMAGAPASWMTCAAATVGTSLAAGAAGTFNQVWETSNDTAMKRTQRRPLPSGRISRSGALAFGASLTAGSGAILLAGTNPLTAGLGLFNIFLYSLVYTPLKTRSEWNTAVGALVGAIPPVMGWVAATGSSLLTPEPMLLALALFWWQFPHFYSLAWTHRKDYARGGFAMVPVLDTDNGKRTAWYALRSSISLAGLPFAAAALGVTSPMFAVEGAVLNGYLLHLSSRFYRSPNDATARALFRCSLWYLPVLLVLMVFHSMHWAVAEEEEGNGSGGSSLVLDAQQPDGFELSVLGDGETAEVMELPPHHAPSLGLASTLQAHQQQHNSNSNNNHHHHGDLSLPSRALELLVTSARDAGRAVCLHETLIKDAAHAGGGGASEVAPAATAPSSPEHASSSTKEVVLKALCPVPAVHTHALANNNNSSTAHVASSSSFTNSSGGGDERGNNIGAAAAEAPRCPITALEKKLDTLVEGATGRAALGSAAAVSVAAVAAPPAR